MSLRLLSKTELQKAKESEKSQAIQEGLKLARKVDGLRETQADEQARLEKFRTETIQAISAEIVKEEKALKELQGEVSQRKKEREEAMKPLTEEWEKLNEAKEEFEAQQESFNERQTSLLEQEKALSQEQKALQDDHVRLKGLLHQHRETLVDAENLKKEHEELVKKATLHLNSLETTIKEQQASIETKEKELALREKKCVATELEMKKEKIKLRHEWKKLNDRRALHERNLKRLHGTNTKRTT